MTKDIYLESEIFQEARDNFNVALQKLLKTMTDKDVSEGNISLGIDLRLVSEYIPTNALGGGTGEAETRLTHKPIIDHKVTTKLTLKNELKGTYTSQMELVYDEDLKKYVLKPVINTAQRSIFDSDYEQNLKGDAETDDGQKAIEGQEQLALPDKQEDGGIIDVDATEIE